MFRSTLKAGFITAVVLAAGIIAEGALDGGIVVPMAQAVIGRPLTPLSYAGVARRTTRRAIYATSVYVATLPRGCTTVIIEGTTLHHCGATYYQPYGNRYVVVNVR